MVVSVWGSYVLFYDEGVKKFKSIEDFNVRKEFKVYIFYIYKDKD